MGTLRAKMECFSYINGIQKIKSTQLSQYLHYVVFRKMLIYVIILVLFELIKN